MVCLAWFGLLAILLPASAFGEQPKIPPETPQQAAQRHAKVAERRKGVDVICHRGASEFAAENTLEAYRATFELGGDGNEIDIRATKDGVLVCFHDDMLDRLLDGYGTVEETTWEQLQRFPFREPGPFGEAARIPTLAEVFDLHRKYGGLLHLDIKQTRIDRAIADLLDRMDMWDHVAYCKMDNGGVILRDARLKLRRYKASLYADRSELFPDAIAVALKRPGDGFIVDDPRGAIVALGRKLGRVSTKPWSGLSARPAGKMPAPPPEQDLIRILRQADDWDRVATTEKQKAEAGQHIRARARAAEDLLSRKASSPEAFAVLEERARNRSLHKDWMYHGFDGAMALRSLILLRAPNAVETARFVLWRDDPALGPVVDPRWKNPRAWTDFRVKMVVFPALAHHPGPATEKLCRDFLALSDEEARAMAPPMLFADAAKTLLAVSPKTETALELLKHRLQSVRGQAILGCLKHGKKPWARAALEQGAPHALKYLASEHADEKPLTGSAAEKRFPPLQLPPGFRATLFACDPLIEYPSVIAIGPRAGSLFVAADYMTGLGTEIVRRDEVRLIEDTDDDGYADKSTTVAAGFNSIQGLAFHQGVLLVMHSPFLSSVRYSPPDGKTGERRELLKGLGLPPETDQIRLHNANGVTVGHDGWLYLALGDHGCDVQRPEGDRLVLEGGGILRCRPDGRDLHVFAKGLRNIYDVALDDELNVFVRDNENDGGTYKIRVCHSFFGADHGYPYRYTDRPDEALPPLADLGLGSSAGGVCYLERQFPPEYRGNLFFCEWGRAVVRYPLQRSASSFAPVKELDIAAGAANDPYGFKPTDLVVDQDGSLFVSDWADDQRPRRGRGRIYRIQYVGGDREKPVPAASDSKKEPLGLDQLVQRLNSDSYHERCQAQAAIESRGRQGLDAIEKALKKNQLRTVGRMHAVWLLAKLDAARAVEKLFAMARSDADVRVQAQTVRALGDLLDPVLVQHRLSAGPVDALVAARLAKLGEGRDGRVLLEVVIALGRTRWPQAPDWLRQNVKKFDPALSHATQWNLRQSDNWPSILKLLDGPNSEPIRAVALRAIAEQYDAVVVDGLIERLRRESDAGRRREYADALTRVYKKPPSWVYWGFRPPPRPANSVAWERTEPIEQELNRILVDPDKTVRQHILARMLREKVPAHTATLVRWLQEEKQQESVAAILQAFRDRPAADVRPALEGVIQDTAQATANRLTAVAIFLKGLDASSEETLLALAQRAGDGPVLAELLRALGTWPKLPAAPLLIRKLSSPAAEVRAASLEALAALRVKEASEAVQKHLTDRDAHVRSTAALAAGKLMVRTAAAPLLQLARDGDADVRRSSLAALRMLREPRVVPLAVAALADRETARQALDCVGALGGPEHALVLAEFAKRDPTTDNLAAVGAILITWAGKKDLTGDVRQAIHRALAEIHGGTGIFLAWQVAGPLAPSAAADTAAAIKTGGGRVVLSTGIDSRVQLGPVGEAGKVWIGQSDVSVPEPARVEFFFSSPAQSTLWLNGKVVYQRERPAVPGPYPDRFEASLTRGSNEVHIQLGDVKGAAEFALRFRRKSVAAHHERLSLAALSRAGNPERGRQLFQGAEKTLCIKCHRVGDQGERIGPELTGLGSRFSKVYIVESILEPSRTISPSFEGVTVLLHSGQSVSGVRIAETETSITLADNEARKHVLAKSDITEQRKAPLSNMPEGLEKKLTEDEFVDLVSYLANLKESRER
jgi:putative membrane-bound dehydrogenase-like protein